MRTTGWWVVSTRSGLRTHRQCNRYELIGACARKCLAALGRSDIRPRVARQDVALPTLWA